MKKIVLSEGDIAILRDGQMIRATVDGEPVTFNGESVVIAHKTIGGIF